MQAKFKKHDKIRVLDKTRDMSKELSPSFATCQKQGYGWIRGVVGMSLGQHAYHVSGIIKSNGKYGEYGTYNESDLAHFFEFETEDDLFHAYIRGEMDETQYKEIKETTFRS